MSGTDFKLIQSSKLSHTLHFILYPWRLTAQFPILDLIVELTWQEGMSWCKIFIRMDFIQRQENEETGGIFQPSFKLHWLTKVYSSNVWGLWRLMCLLQWGISPDLLLCWQLVTLDTSHLTPSTWQLTPQIAGNLSSFYFGNPNTWLSVKMRGSIITFTISVLDRYHFTWWHTHKIANARWQPTQLWLDLISTKF